MFSCLSVLFSNDYHFILTKLKLLSISLHILIVVLTFEELKRMNERSKSGEKHSDEEKYERKRERKFNRQSTTSDFFLSFSPSSEPLFSW
jgi:hypothetical protein